MKLYFDSLTTLKVIYAESPIVIFFGTYGIDTVTATKEATSHSILWKFSLFLWDSFTWRCDPGIR